MTFTPEEIIAMGRRAGALIEAAQDKDVQWLTRFAQLVADKAAARERDSCAQLVQDKQELDPYAGLNGWVLADAIRARGQKGGA